MYYNIKLCLHYNIRMDNKEKNINSNFSINNIEEDEYGQIEMTLNEPHIDYNEVNDYDTENDSSDNLSEFNDYREIDFDSEDDLENTLDLHFDFDIIFTKENNSELLQLTEIKSKIVNRIKLNALDLVHIKNIGDKDKFDLIKLFNHMI